MILGAVAMGMLALVPITLDEVRRGARDNVDALRAALASRQATADIGVSRAALLPQVNLSARGAASANGPRRFFTTIPEPTGTGSFRFRQDSVDVEAFSQGDFALELGVSQLLYDGMATFERLAQATANAESKRWLLREQELLAEAEAVRRFFELYRAQAAAEVAQATAQSSERQLARASAMFEAGRAQRREVLDSEVNLGSDRMAVVKRRPLIVDAQVGLALWLGRPSSVAYVAVAPPELSSAKDGGPALDEAGLISLALRRRPLLHALERAAASARAAVGAKRAEWLPRVSLFGAYQRSAPAAAPFFGDPLKQNEVTGGVGIEWNLFAGLSTTSELKHVEAAAELAALELERARHDVEGQVRQAVAAVRAQQEIISLAGANVASARAALVLAEERFGAGAGSTLEVRDAQLKVALAELALIEGRVDSSLARAALEHVVGGMNVEGER